MVNKDEYKITVEGYHGHGEAATQLGGRRLSTRRPEAYLRRGSHIILVVGLAVTVLWQSV